MAEHGVEDLPDRHERAVDGALRHSRGATQPVPPVADEHQDPLAPEPGQLPLGYTSCVLGCTQDVTPGRCRLQLARQLERGDETGGLGGTDARAAGQFLRSSGCETGERVELGEQLVGEVECTGAGGAVPEDERKQFSRSATRRRAPRAALSVVRPAALPP